MPAGDRVANARTAKRTGIIGAARRICSPADAWKLRPREREERGKPRALQAAQFENPRDASENRSIPSWPFFDGLASLEKRLAESEQERKIETAPLVRAGNARPWPRRISPACCAAASSRIAAAAFPPEPTLLCANARSSMAWPRLPSDRHRPECREAGSVANIRAGHGRRHPGDESARARLRRAEDFPMEDRQRVERFRGDSSGHAARTPPRAGAGGAVTLDIGFPYMERKPPHVGASCAGVTAGRGGMEIEELA